MERISTLVKQDKGRLKILEIAAKLDLPDCFIAAGFVRNLVWDYLHDYKPTKLNDIDVIFFDNTKKAEALLHNAEIKLEKIAPEINWEVKNQAIMHKRNNDRPYFNSTEAMTFWPEKETAIGLRLENDGSIFISAPFGVSSLFKGAITFNPNSNKKAFLERIEKKQWLKKWPNLQIVL